MSTNTTRFAIADLRYLVGLSAAGQTDGQIADALTARGVQLPQWDGIGNPVPQLGMVGYNLPIWRGYPGRWIPEAVAVVRSCPEADSTDSFAVARAKLGSGIVTTLTVP